MNLIDRRYDRIAMMLNHDAYLQQMSGRNKPLKQFIPCAKALVFTAAIGTGKVSSEVMMDAMGTVCGCHPGLEELDLLRVYCEIAKSEEA